MPTDFFVRFGTMGQTGENGFWWEDFKDNLLENSRTVLITILALFGLLIITVFVVKFPEVIFFPWLLIAGSLSAGVFHSHTLNTQFNSLLSVERWIYTSVIAAILFLFISLAVWLFTRFNLLVPAATVSAFLLPTTLARLWQLFGELPTTEPQVWYYSAEASSKKSTTFLNSIPVSMQIHLSGQTNAERLSFQAPVRMNLGLLLFHAIQEGHAQGRFKFDLTEPAARGTGWIFYTTGLAGQRRYLNPDKGLTENRINRNSVIHAQQHLPTASVNTDTSSTKPIPVR